MKERKIPNVERKHGAYHYRKWNKDKKRNDWTYLCRIEDGESAMYEALAKITGQVPNQLRGLFALFIADQSVEIAAVTREKYKQQLEGPVAHRFGHMHPDHVTSQDIAIWLEDGKKRGASVATNRCRSALSSFYDWAMRNGIAKANPCRGVRRNKERPSRIYVKDSQLVSLYGRASEALKHLVNGKYLSGMRLTDIMDLKRHQLTEAGIEFTESKTGKVNTMAWKPGLREVVNRAIAHGDAIATKVTKRLPQPRPLPTHVFVNSRGKPWTQWGVSSAMARAGADFAIRHLRSKAETDAAETVTGHKGQMRERYIKRRKLTPVM